MRVVVGYGPGGGYDTYARFLAPHLEARLGTTVIVENQPGAGGFNALGALLREPGDGLRILMLNGEASVLAQLVDKAGVRFDLRKLGYLGRVSYENRTLIANKGSERRCRIRRPAHSRQRRAQSFPYRNRRPVAPLPGTQRAS